MLIDSKLIHINAINKEIKKRDKNNYKAKKKSNENFLSLLEEEIKEIDKNSHNKRNKLIK